MEIKLPVTTCDDQDSLLRALDNTEMSGDCSAEGACYSRGDGGGCDRGVMTVPYTATTMQNYAEISCVGAVACLVQGLKAQYNGRLDHLKEKVTISCRHSQSSSLSFLNSGAGIVNLLFLL